MMAGTHFRFPLQPVLLLRQWDRDALLADLSRINASIFTLRAELASLAGEAGDTAHAWTRRARASSDFHAGDLAVVTTYLRDKSQQSAVRQSTLDALDRDAAAVVEKVAAASKALQAVERHRDRLRKDFDQARASTDYKLADEQWSARLASKDCHEA
jgi:flagellar export protein FliJ